MTPIQLRLNFSERTLSGAVARCHIVVVLHDVGAIPHTDELRIVCALHLRRGDFDEPLHHHIAR